MTPGEAQVPFTRADVERLKAIEISSGATAEALKALVIAVDSYEQAHSKLHEELVKITTNNAQFVRGFRTVRKVGFGIMTGSAGLWILDKIATASGLIH